MKYLNNYYKYIIKYDYINKFNTFNISNIPTLKKIVITFENKDNSYFNYILTILAMEIISNQRGSLLKYMNSNVIKLKSKSQVISSCKVNLRNQNMFNFLYKCILSFNSGHQTIKKTNCNFKLNNFNLFNLIEDNYNYFHNLPKLKVYLVFSNNDNKNNSFLLNSLKLII